MILKAFLSFFLTSVLTLFVPIFIMIRIKKKYRFSYISFFFGVLVLLLLLAAFFIAFKMIFHEYSRFNVLSLKILLLAFIVMIIGIIRFFAIKISYLKGKDAMSALSFGEGFGSCMAIFLGLYTLINFLLLTYLSIFDKIIKFDNVKSTFETVNGFSFTVFSPLEGHISYAIATLSFFVMETAIVYMLINTFLYGKLRHIYKYFLAFIFEILFLTAFVFPTAFHFNHYMSALVTALLSSAFSLIAYKLSFMKKEDDKESYQKQFE